MWLLTFLVILFIVIIGLIIYSNFPKSSSGQSCGGCDQSCPKCPCNRCGMSKKHCRCPYKMNCQFC